MEEYKWIKFDTHPTEFIKYNLSCGNTLSQLFLEEFKETRIKNVYGLLPSSIKREKMMELQWGGVWALNKRDSFFMDFVSELKSYDYTIVFQNVLKEKTYPYVKHYVFPYATYKKEIYFVYTVKNDDESLLNEYLKKADLYPFIAFFLEGKEITSNDLALNDLKETLPYIRYIIMGAYDEESFIRIEIE